MDHDHSSEGGRPVFLPLYSEEDWKIQEANARNKSGIASYAEWQGQQRKLREASEEHGLRVVEVPVDARAMQKYFEENGLANDGRNRAKYFAMRAGELGLI